MQVITAGMDMTAVVPAPAITLATDVATSTVTIQPPTKPKALLTRPHAGGGKEEEDTSPQITQPQKKSKDTTAADDASSTANAAPSTATASSTSPDAVATDGQISALTKQLDGLTQEFRTFSLQLDSVRGSNTTTNMNLTNLSKRVADAGNVIEELSANPPYTRTEQIERELEALREVVQNIDLHRAESIGIFFGFPHGLDAERRYKWSMGYCQRWIFPFGGREVMPYRSYSVINGDGDPLSEFYMHFFCNGARTPFQKLYAKNMFNIIHSDRPNEFTLIKFRYCTSEKRKSIERILKTYRDENP